MRKNLPPKYGHVPRLRKMFDIMGIVWEGKQHSGIVDARNTGKGISLNKVKTPIMRPLNRFISIFRQTVS